MKVDPIREKYFAPVERAELWSMLLFYATALISIALLFVNKGQLPRTYDAVQASFLALAVAGFVLGLLTKLYWAPRGGEKRIADFMSSAFAVQLTTERTNLYYNNSESEPLRKIALQTLENCHFTKEISRLMCGKARPIVCGYFVLWIFIVAYRQTPIDFIVIAGQVLFSEEIISGMVRLEWLRAKSEKVYDAIYRHINAATPGTPAFAANVIEFLVCYENHKATSNVTLSSSVFNRHNARLSAEWDRIRASLGA